MQSRKGNQKLKALEEQKAGEGGGRSLIRMKNPVMKMCTFQNQQKELPKYCPIPRDQQMMMMVEENHLQDGSKKVMMKMMRNRLKIIKRGSLVSMVQNVTGKYVTVYQSASEPYELWLNIV